MMEMPSAMYSSLFGAKEKDAKSMRYSGITG